MVGFLRFFATGIDKTQINDQDEIDRLYKKHRLRIMLTIILGYGFAYTCRLALSVVKKPLIDGGIFTANDLGVIGSGIFYCYGFGKLFNGILADHANIKRFLPLGILLSALVNISMGWSAVLWIWILLWGLNGWFQGFGAPASVVAMTNWFSNRELGRNYGIWSTAHAIGEGLTFVGVAALVSYFGWRAGFIGPGIFCVFVAIVMYYFLQDRPRTLGLPAITDWVNVHGDPTSTRENPKKTSQFQLQIFKRPAIWILGLASATMYVTRYAINSWGILYLQEAKGYSLVEAGGMLGLNTIAGILGCVAYGYISDKLFQARRPPVTLIFGIIEVVSVLVIFFAPSGQNVLLAAAFIVYGFTLSGLLAALGGLFAVDIASKKAAGAAMGFVGVFSYMGAATQDLISGYLIEQGTTIVDGVRYYDFSEPIIFWIGSSVVSMFLAASLWRVKVSD